MNLLLFPVAAAARGSNGPRSAAAAGDGVAAARVGVGLGAGAAVVVGRAPHGAGHVVPPQRAVAYVPVVLVLQHPARHGVAVGEAELLVLRRAHHPELPPEGRRRRHLARAGQRRQRQQQEERDQERARRSRHGGRGGRAEMGEWEGEEVALLLLGVEVGCALLWGSAAASGKEGMLLSLSLSLVRWGL
uniref:Uncharacterized protein n=1 Tax=Setaria viridis TaxID=4556 RepID=A0A4U6UHE5_SETVI|nr:hypothetical protein SEVIR_5G163650v2 [Setaria viridis]